MRLLKSTIVVSKRDTYGPFPDGRTIDYIEFIDTDGGGIMRATFANGFDPVPALMVPGSKCDADLELYQAEKGLRLRVHTIAESAPVLGLASEYVA